MSLASRIFVGVVALIHLYFFYLEAIVWTNERTRKIFRMDTESANRTKVFAQNMGLYNLFLAGGLIWSCTISDYIWSIRVASYFVTCVIVAGIVGGMTVGKRVLWVQALPGAIAGICLLLREIL